ncbi:hypothetical protein L1887_09949 [Cichorium endivia]|nr:hypothetical protein L1887_09949 [Cichorium endivia]
MRNRRNSNSISTSFSVIGVLQFVQVIVTQMSYSIKKTTLHKRYRGINAPTSRSLANYVLLAIFYGGILICRKSKMKAKWYYYILLRLIDVEENYLVVKAYQYTSLTSDMLLDCWSSHQS